MQLEILTLSKPGGRTVNEDACGFRSSPTACFCVLSDGLGGHGGGDVASKLVVRHILDVFGAQPECSPAAIEAALASANLALAQAQGSDPRLAHMRATAVVLAIDTQRGEACWGHVGDSRLYCLRQGRIFVQTRDHSIVQNMVDAGYLKAADLRGSAHRNHIYTALGDVAHFAPSITSTSLTLRDRDVFLLCTDGFWEYVDEPELERTLAAAAGIEDWLRTLEDQVLARGSAGQDNYSAVAIWCSAPQHPTEFAMQAP